jgi:two-component system nitrate/nitrite response regulator NarL
MADRASSSATPIRVLVVIDVCVHRHLLVEALDRQPSIEVAVGVDGVGATLDRLRRNPGGWVVLLDLAGSETASTVRTIIRAAPDARVIALAVSEAEPEVVAYAEAGVSGYLPRGDSFADLVAAIESVARGETRCSPSVAATLLRRVATLSGEPGPQVVPTLLTPREREVMQLVEDGLSNKQIATRLSIELRTVKNHVHHILEKFQVHRRAEAVALFRTVRRPPVRSPARYRD